jgi:UPF0755 protein
MRVRDRQVPRWLWVTALVAVVALVVLGVGGVWVHNQVDPPGGPGKPVAVDVPEGTSTGKLIDLLADKHVVASSSVFRLYVRVKGAGPFQAGLYNLRENSAMGDVISTLKKGPSLPAAVNITIPEGEVLAQIAARVQKRDPRLSAEQFSKIAASGTIKSRYSPPGETSLEGLLFPDTYRVERTDTEAILIQRMAATFDSLAQSIGYDQATQKVGYSAYQTIIVASLVEAEAKDDSDRPKIARVIYNRLAKRIPLGIDAAFYYTLPLDRRGTALRQSDLDRDTPYNTRLHTGLVPTPIDMPGRPSLEAALNPAPGDWLYYVLKDERTHAFSSTYDQFLRDKAAAEAKGLLK